MTSVLATELKQNFKVYAGKAASGEVVKILRPKKEDDLILMSEHEFNLYRRILMYYAKLNKYGSVEELLESDLDKQNEKSFYDEEFLSLFGCLKDEEFEVPEDLSWDLDVKREELM